MLEVPRRIMQHVVKLLREQTSKAAKRGYVRRFIVKMNLSLEIYFLNEVDSHCELVQLMLFVRFS